MQLNRYLDLKYCFTLFHIVRFLTTLTWRYILNVSDIIIFFQSCGNIYKGLAQVGAWGCFDEFNRISVEVLSVVAVQVKSVLDGVKSRKPIFLFFGEELNLVPTVGMFITMNPGYAGRTELPENLKTLFRYVKFIISVVYICTYTRLQSYQHWNSNYIPY